METLRHGKRSHSFSAGWSGSDGRGGHDPLLEAAREAKVYVGAICGGEGTCGKCRLIVHDGEVEGNAIEFFTRDEIRHGYVLACQSVPLGDLLVEVPPESQLPGYISIVKDSERFRDFVRRTAERTPVAIDPLVKKFFLALPEPTLDDPTADQERVLEAVAQEVAGPAASGTEDHAGAAAHAPLLLSTRLFLVMEVAWPRDGDGGLPRRHQRGSQRGAGRYLAQNYGLALDVGTTTVVGHLVDLTSGVTLEAAAKYNSQIEYGADIITRLNHARQPGGAETLQRLIVHDIDSLINELVQHHPGRTRRHPLRRRGGKHRHDALSAWASRPI